MAVEEDGRGPRCGWRGWSWEEVAVEELQEGHVGGELVDEEVRGLEGAKLAAQGDLDYEVQLAEDGADDGEAREDGCWEEGVAPDADVEGA